MRKPLLKNRNFGVIIFIIKNYNEQRSVMGFGLQEPRWSSLLSKTNIYGDKDIDSLKSWELIQNRFYSRMHICVGQDRLSPYWNSDSFFNRQLNAMIYDNATSDSKYLCVRELIDSFRPHFSISFHVLLQFGLSISHLLISQKDSLTSIFCVFHFWHHQLIHVRLSARISGPGINSKGSI